MSITKERVEELIKEFGLNENNSGTAEVQVSILTERIRNITEHLKENKKDNSSRRGLIIQVAKRRKLLNYIKRNNFKVYKSIIEKLNIRK